MSLFEVVCILLAGVAAGTINTVVGAGSLVTFPTLLLFGYPPVVANMTNAVGLVAGGASGVHGYRRELAGEAPTLRRLVPATLVGALAGALLLLVLPAEVFEVVVPLLIGLGVVLVLLGPRFKARAARRRAAGATPRTHRVALPLLVGLTGVYGGYFGAAQGVLLVGILGAMLPAPLQTVNGIKNVLGLVANATSALVFVVVVGSDIAWWTALVLGTGALLGGVLGARIGRRLPPPLLRAVIATIGVVAIVRMLFG
ncbi:sulfite exporter TauE/SafE family protein [Mobilicoccus pelagius]|uniref:Probable membrane transporter protein n=1 Tax=Mobilicoccus pelagius NBRC 104925 TaxID=1089455 RepID=H5UTI9_9MICO|nr:sulfite exporter TauE/SafE family protein [Mobilicoccus pelagius]GAB49047.1 hypothetical protein MOPEL_096_00540 [Mobilicoccus pelagius NBRC 104925]